MIPFQKIVQPSVTNQASQGPLHYVAYGGGTLFWPKKLCKGTVLQEQISNPQKLVTVVML